MTLYPPDAQDLGPVPTATARGARAAFPQGHLSRRRREEGGGLSTDFAPVCSTRGRPAEAPWRLARGSLLPEAEGLSDRQAADAVRGRRDGKEVLGLGLTDAGFEASVLSESRTRLVTGGAEPQLLDPVLDPVLERFGERHGLNARGRQRTDSPPMLAAIRPLHRLESVGETLRQARTVLAVVAPDRVRTPSPPE